MVTAVTAVEAAALVLAPLVTGHGALLVTAAVAAAAEAYTTPPPWSCSVARFLTMALVPAGPAIILAEVHRAFQGLPGLGAEFAAAGLSHGALR